MTTKKNTPTNPLKERPIIEAIKSMAAQIFRREHGLRTRRGILQKSLRDGKISASEYQKRLKILLAPDTSNCWEKSNSHKRVLGRNLPKRRNPKAERVLRAFENGSITLEQLRERLKELRELKG